MNFKAIIIVDNIVAGLKATVVKILTQKFRNRYREDGDKFLTNLALVDAWIYIMRERTSSYANAGVDSSHVIEDGV